MSPSRERDVRLNFLTKRIIIVPNSSLKPRFTKKKKSFSLESSGLKSVKKKLKIRVRP